MFVEAHRDHATCRPLTSHAIDRDNPPGYLYMQVAQHIAQRIATGDLPMNRRLPAELQLAREYASRSAPRGMRPRFSGSTES
jgi:Bacterial regulatory proteins, gntR family